MTTSPHKVIAIVGATGNQGSSVAHTFLSLPNWHVRCLTRNPSSPASQALAAQGAELIEADLSSLPSLHHAFEDANAIFLNTDFWATYLGSDTADRSEEAFGQEVQHGKNAAIAAAGVKSLERLVYSALGPMKKHSKGKYPHSYHWDSKASIVEYIETKQPELAAKTSFIYLGAYTTNPLFMPRVDPADGTYTFFLPLNKETRMPIIDPTESTGPFVRALVEDEPAGTKLLAYDSYLTIGAIVKTWSTVSGQEAKFVGVPAEVMHGQFGIPIEVLDAPGFIAEYGYTGGIDGIIEPGQLRTEVQTRSFEEWLELRDWKALLEVGGSELKGYEGR